MELLWRTTDVQEDGTIGHRVRSVFYRGGLVPVIWAVAFFVITLVAAVTHKRGSAWGLGSYLLVLVGWAVVAVLLSSREVFSSAMLGSLLGLPVLLGILVTRTRRKVRRGPEEAVGPSPRSGYPI